MFSPEYFRGLLKREVDGLAADRYKGDKRKAFPAWFIGNRGTKLSKEEVEAARGICETAGPGDKGIDGAWLDGKAGPLYLIQAKWDDKLSPAEDNADAEEEGEDEEEEGPADPKIKSFDAKPAKELMDGFNEVIKVIEGKSHASQKLVQLAALYNKARSENRKIELAVVVAGTYGKPLGTKVEELNEELHKRSQHHMKVYDLEALNRLRSERFAPPVEPITMAFDAKLTVEGGGAADPYALVATVPALELVRIRQENEENIYHANFRFVLKSSPVRRGMQLTLASPTERKNFWRYNNGITVICKKVEQGTSKLTIHGFQVVNGLQTVETIFDFAGLQTSKDWAKDVMLNVRVIPVADFVPKAGEKSLAERIAEYSNSQNPIEARDLRSNDPVQVELDVEVSNLGLRYQRKRGQYRKGFGIVDNERASQYVLSFWRLRPAAAKNKKKMIFEHSAEKGFYEEIFVAGATRPSWFLLPYLLMENLQLWISQKNGGPIAKNGNYLMLATAGWALQKTLPYGKPGSVDEKADEKLLRLIGDVRATNYPKKKALNKVWSEAYDLVRKIVEERQAEAKAKGLEIPSERNILVGLEFADIEPHIPATRASDLPETLRKLFKLE